MVIKHRKWRGESDAAQTVGEETEKSNKLRSRNCFKSLSDLKAEPLGREQILFGSSHSIKKDVLF